MKNKKKIKIEIWRKDGKTFLHFEIDPSLEELFKKQKEEIRESGSWKGLKFYYIPELTKNDGYKNLLYKHNLIDDFGTSLYAGNTFNIAFLRTVGGKGKIQVSNDIPFASVYKNFNKVKIVGIHTRQATSGKIDVQNTHFFEIGNYLFAHNGIVGDYYCGYGTGYQKIKRFGGEGGFTLRSGEIDYDADGAIIEKPPAKIKDDKMCDSYNFFKALPKPITKKVLEDAVDNEFSGAGVGLIIDKKDKKIFLMTTREVKAHTDFENYLFIYSFDPSNKLRNYHHYCGFKMYNPNEEEELETLNIPSGVYEFDYDLKVELVKEIKDK